MSGIYMLHEIAIQLVLSLGGTSNMALYGGAIILTIAAASACYLWFERPFLRMKPYASRERGGLKPALR